MIQAIDDRAQLPGPLNRLLLEVIPKREVAQHLEEGVVPGSATHVLDVVGANALLAAGRTGGRPLLLTEKDRLERQHSRDREQNRGVLRHERGTGHPSVTTLLIKSEERFPDLRTSAGTSCLVSRRSCNSHGGFGLEQQVLQP